MHDTGAAASSASAPTFPALPPSGPTPTPRGWRDGGRTRWWQWPARLAARLQADEAGRTDDIDWLEHSDPDEYWRRVGW